MLSAKEILKDNIEKIKYDFLNTNQKVSKISVIGMGMMSQSGVAEKCLKHLQIIQLIYLQYLHQKLR